MGKRVLSAFGLFATLTATLMFSNAARADRSIECSTPGNKTIEVVEGKSWMLRDPNEPSLRSFTEIAPITETATTLEFLHDFGSDSVKRLYSFSDISQCGIYDSNRPVVTLTVSLRNIRGELRNTQIWSCTCGED